MAAACRALTRLSPISEQRIGRLRSLWPEMEQVSESDDWMAGLGRLQGTRRDDTVTRLPATMDDVTALDEVITWHGLLRPGDTAKVAIVNRRKGVVMPPDVWQVLLERNCVDDRGQQRSWRKIAQRRRIRQSHEQMRRVYRAGLALLARRLNER